MDKLVFEPYAFDLTHSRLMIAGKEICLTSKEYQLALHLFSNQGNIVSRSDLLETVWQTSAEIHTRTVDAHVSRLRQKLQLTDFGWEITGIYKRGYCLRKKRAPVIERVNANTDVVTEG